MAEWAVKNTDEYQAISTLYGERRAKRSKVLYMNHINEGLLVLSAIGANLETKRAWCLHPIFQNDDDLAANWLRYEFDYRVTVLAMEYRNVANQYLANSENPAYVLSVLPQVNQMLKADKIQNYKDLVTYGVDHPNFMGLVAYFHTWFGMLGIDERFRDHLMKVCHAGD